MWPTVAAGDSPAFPPPPIRVIATQGSSSGWWKFSDVDPQPDASGFVVLITKSVQTLQCIGHGFRLSRRRYGEGNGQNADDYPKTFHGDTCLCSVERRRKEP